MYRFVHGWRQHKAGDPAPDTLDPGIRATLVTRGVLEAVAPFAPVAVGAEDDDAADTFRAPANKAMKTGTAKVKRK